MGGSAGPDRAIAAALADPLLQVRLGAVVAAPDLAPGTAGDLLAGRAAVLDAAAAPVEAAALAVALARVGRGDEARSLAAGMLGDPPDALDGALTAEPGHWGRHLAAKVEAGAVPSRAANLLASLPVGLHAAPLLAIEAAIRDPNATPAFRCRLALSELHNWRRLHGQGAVLASAQAALEADDFARAASLLIDAAIRDREPWTRLIARKALRSLGRDAAAPLLSLLAGGPGPRPEETVLSAIAAESGLNAPPVRVPADELAAFLAAEALQESTDPRVATALAAMAITASPAAPRAADVLARMSADVGLPPLVWTGLNGPSPEVRDAAAALLGRILGGDDSPDAALPHVDAEEIDPRTLDWVSGLAERSLTDLPWAADPEIALAVIGRGIGLIPAMGGGQGTAYQLPPTLQRLETFRRNTRLLRAGGPPGAALPAPAPAVPPPADRGGATGNARTGSSISKGLFGDTVERPDRFNPEVPSDASPSPAAPPEDRVEPPDDLGDGDFDDSPAARVGPAPAAPPALPTGVTPPPAPPAPLPAARLLRHPRTEFPARCRLGVSAPLAVQLLPLAGPATHAPFDVAFPAETPSVTLTVVVRGRGFDIAPDLAPLRVPRDGASEAVIFQLTPRETGEQAIDVKFYAGATMVGHCALVSTVEAGGADGQAETLLLEQPGPPPLDASTDEASPFASLLVRTLRDGRLAWTMLRRDAPPLSLGTSAAAIATAEIQQWTAGLGPLIQQFQSRDLSDGDMRGVMAQLVGLGMPVLEQIAPQPAIDAIAALPEDALLVVESDAEWVPWELLPIGATGPLWAERFVLVRSPLVVAPPGPVPIPTSPPAVLDRAVLVIGDDITGTPEALARRLFGAMASRAKPPLVQVDWPTLSEGAARADILHFACHGRGSPYYFSYGAAEARRLYPAQARALGLRFGTVVFANACSSAAAQLLLAEFQSFGRAFYLAGARPFIGTLGPVPEEEAADFAGLFYEGFAQAGLTAGQALRRARQAARDRFRVPIWLFYCLYGNASAVRRWNAASPADAPSVGKAGAGQALAPRQPLLGGQPSIGDAARSSPAAAKAGGLLSRLWRGKTSA